jgi:hypothetical protein
MKKTELALLLGLLSLVGTARAADAPAAAPGKPVIDATVAPKLPPRSTIDWEKMDVGQRKKYMKTTVLPQMKKLFVGFNKKYGDMSCGTCHGGRATEVKFKMPNAELPKLPGPTDRQGFMALNQKKPDAVKFMGTQVKPALAALLNIDEWSPTNTKGFGCYGCHTTEAAPGAPPAAAPAAPAAPSKPAAPAKPAGGGW